MREEDTHDMGILSCDFLSISVTGAATIFLWVIDRNFEQYMYIF